MGLREQIETTIRNKENEIKLNESKIRDARLVVQALRDALQSSGDEQEVRDISRQQRKKKIKPGKASLRPDSAPYKVKELLKSNGHPVHISEILLGIGLTKDNKSSLVSTLSGYVKERKEFTRTAPNTFGLIEWENEVTGQQQPGTSV